MSEPGTDVPRQLTRAVDRFRTRFHREPRFAAVAPGRVNLIGEHTDYNDGFVLPMAIQRQTLVVADRRPDRMAQVVTTGAEREAAFTVNAALQPGDPPWSNYVRGVVALCVREDGLGPGGFDAVIDSTVPLGGGLSSSAAIEVATATLIEAMAGRALTPVAKALLCQKAEHLYPRVPCGIMDQFISTMGVAGHAMLLDCRSRQMRMVAIADPAVAVLIANTNVRHALTGGEYAQRRSQCEAAAKALGVPSLRDATWPMLVASRASLEPAVYRRAAHVIGEIARATQAAKELEAGDWAAAGRLMVESHLSLRNDYEVSCPELDVLVDLALELDVAGGVYGSRMTGAGFGGCTVSLVQSAQIDAITRHLHEGYQARTGIEPTIFATQAADGARVLSV